MPTIVQDIVRLKNIPTSLCEKLDGIQTRDGDCVIVIELDENKPNVAKLIGLELKRGLR